MKILTAAWPLILGNFLIYVTQTAQSPITLSSEFQVASQHSLITENSIGSVHLGMTVAQARRALPGLKLSRTTDGEGVALIAVKRGADTLMTLYAGEANPAARINEQAAIEFIEVWDRGYSTSDGVNPKMPLREVEEKYGNLRDISLSEIESREYATFAGQPSWIQLRVANESGMAGVYPEGQIKATQYTPASYIFSISIRKAPRNKPRFSSAYTQLRTQCKGAAPAKDEGQHTSSFCKGYGDYRIHLSSCVSSNTAAKVSIHCRRSRSGKCCSLRVCLALSI